MIQDKKKRRAAERGGVEVGVTRRAAALFTGINK